MTNIIAFRCNQKAKIKYNLNSDDLVFLDWMKGFASNIKIKKIMNDEEHFFWIKYSKVLEDLPSIFINVLSIRRRIAKLSANNHAAMKPLISKLVATSHGVETYFAFNPVVMDELEGNSMSGFDDELGLTKLKSKIKESNYKKIPVNKNVQFIFERIKKFSVNDKELFPHASPLDDHHYSKTFAQFQEALYSLYEGKFLTNYSFNTFEEWFQLKYKYYLQKDKIIENIKACKGDWEAIRKLLVKAIKNYIKWFDSESEQRDKSKLPRNINAFIYDRFNHLSMFYVCLIEGPTDLREAEAEKTFDTILPNYRKIALKIYDKSFDGFLFWNKIKSVLQWYKKYSKELSNSNDGCYYWLSIGCEEFLADYISWLYAFTDEAPFINNIGINNLTWKTFIKEKKTKHAIYIDIPLTL